MLRKPGDSLRWILTTPVFAMRRITQQDYWPSLIRYSRKVSITRYSILNSQDETHLERRFGIEGFPRYLLVTEGALPP